MAKWTNQQLKDAVQSSSTMKETLEKIGFPPIGCYYTFFKKKIIELKIDNTHWKKYVGKRVEKRTLEETLEKSAAKTIRKRIIKDKIFEYKCSICALSNWLNNPISLQLDHIDGNNTNNKLENLRLLCPNCHSQTDTFCGRNIKSLKITKYCECGKLIRNESTTCRDCASKLKINTKTKIDWPSNEELLKELESMPCISLAKKLGVSDSSIRKRLKRKF
jgi:Zn finger protein HypA/HybF involved in hydrogenase expression